MPDTIALSAFVIGLVLVIAALLGTKVKIVQVELPELNGPKRVITGVLGAILVTFGLADGKLPQVATVALATPAGQTAAAPPAAASAAALPCFGDVPAANVHTVPVAMDRRVDAKFPYGPPHDDVVAIQWSDGKALLGGVKLRTLTSEVGFDISDVYDGACNRIETYRNLDRTDVPKDKPISYDTLRYDLPGAAYIMDVSYQSEGLLSIRARQVAP
jgi:hypothetical protein